MLTIRVVLIVLTWLTTVSSRNNELTTVTQCICPGFNLTYECSVVGPGRTVWKGTAFHGCINNKITLRHSLFSSGDAIGTCNNGAFVGRGVREENNNCYVSQLNITITPDVVGTDIICSYDDGLNEIDIANTTVALTTDPLAPPNDIALTDITPTKLAFKWNSVGFNCPAVRYNITASNTCGICPDISNKTTASCINPQLPQANTNITCVFSVRTEVCEGIVGAESNLVTSRLTVPGIPTVTVVPSYLQSGNDLTSISATITELPVISISNGINMSIISYNLAYKSTVSDAQCGSAVVPAALCNNGVCHHKFDVLSSPCPRSAELSVTVFATNMLGDGEVSNEFLVEFTNNFVNFGYNRNTRSIVCSFINERDNSDSEKFCRITFGLCNEQQTITIQENSTGNHISLLLSDNLQRGTYCYVATASNSSFSVNIVNGRLDLTADDSRTEASTNIGAIVGVIITILGALVVVTVVVFIVKYKGILHHRANSRRQSASMEAIEQCRFEKFKVQKDCELGQFIQQNNRTYRKGSIFYEFTRNEEDISPEKEVILMDERTQQLYTGEGARKKIGAPGLSVQKPKLENYSVFIQSSGIGRRPLPAGSRILYDSQHEKHSPSSQPKTNFKPVRSDRFIKIDVKSDEGGELISIVEKQQLKFKPGCAFFEFVNDQEDISEGKEVILMNKVTGKMFTGPGAQSKIGAPDSEIKRPNLDEWRVFVQSLYKGNRYICGNTLLLYEEPALDVNSELLDPVEPAERFQVFNVNENCNLRFFVEKRCKLTYEARRFFFEFVFREEEITDDKEIILMDKDANEKKYTGKTVKKMIGAPGKFVKMPTLRQYRVFVQSGGAGTRYLKVGTSILYEVSD